MFTGGSVKETLAFIDGYRFGNVSPISEKIFDRYVCVRNSFPESYIWTYVIDACSTDENDAMRMIDETITEFLQLKNRMSDDELIQYAGEQLVEEGEAEKIFRQFNKALLLGDQSLIRPLIEEHKDADILWRRSYPEDVAIQLNEISGNQRVRSIPISADGKKIKIIAGGWPFPIEMNFRNGKWIINAKNIIEMQIKINGA